MPNERQQQQQGLPPFHPRDLNGRSGRPAGVRPQGVTGSSRSGAAVPSTVSSMGRQAGDGRSREVTNGSFVAAKLTEEPCAQRRLRGSPDARSGSAAVRRVWQLNGRLQTQAVCQTVKYRTSGTTDRRRQKTVAQPLRRSVRARPGADLRASEMDAVEETFDPQKRAHTA